MLPIINKGKWNGEKLQLPGNNLESLVPIVIIQVRGSKVGLVSS